MADDNPPPNENTAESSYEIGYAKPPKHSQFKAENKAGKGRPRGSRNMKSLVREVFEDKVPAKINGKTRKVSRVELGLRQLANKASTGDLKAIAHLLTLYERYGPPEEDGPISEEETAYDLETLRHHLRMKGYDDE